VIDIQESFGFSRNLNSRIEKTRFPYFRRPTVKIMTSRRKQHPEHPPQLQRSGSHPILPTDPASPLASPPSNNFSFPNSPNQQHTNAPPRQPRRFLSHDDFKGTQNTAPTYTNQHDHNAFNGNNAYLAPPASKGRRSSPFGTLKLGGESMSKSLLAIYCIAVILIVWLVFTAASYMFVPSGMQQSAWQREFDCK
jgi:hypothetical protein